MTKDEVVAKVQSGEFSRPCFGARDVIDRLESLGLLTFDKPLPPLPVVKRGDKVRISLRYAWTTGDYAVGELIGTLVDLEKL